VTIDEELTVLDTQLRRLKIEYEIYFSNPAKRPPTEVEWKVLSLLRKFSDGGRMSFSQRFRYNELAQRYAIYSDLWRKKNRIREEGYRRPQDALLAIQGLRTDEEHAAAAALNPKRKRGAESDAPPAEPFVVQCSDVSAERQKAESLYQAIAEAKRALGDPAPSGKLESFINFLHKRTEQIKAESGCAAVEYRVEVAGGKVALKAKAKR
jgi:hypothetical protein